MMPVTDLTDPVQCAAVAVDYLLELEGITGAGTEDHQLYTSYNAGPLHGRLPLYGFCTRQARTTGQ